MVSPAPKPIRVLMVCLGNICRSPTAEAMLRRKVHEAGLDDRVEVDSAGTADYHVDSPPDRRAVLEAAVAAEGVLPLPRGVGRRVGQKPDRPPG